MSARGRPPDAKGGPPHHEPPHAAVVPKTATGSSLPHEADRNAQHSVSAGHVNRQQVQLPSEGHADLYRLLVANSHRDKAGRLVSWWTQEQLAAKLRISVRTLRNRLADLREPGLDPRHPRGKPPGLRLGLICVEATTYVDKASGRHRLGANRYVVVEQRQQATEIMRLTSDDTSTLACLNKSTTLSLEREGEYLPPVTGTAGKVADQRTCQCGKKFGRRPRCESSARPRLPGSGPPPPLGATCRKSRPSRWPVGGPHDPPDLASRPAASASSHADPPRAARPTTPPLRPRRDPNRPPTLPTGHPTPRAAHSATEAVPATATAPVPPGGHPRATPPPDQASLALAGDMIAASDLRLRGNTTPASAAHSLARALLAAGGPDSPHGLFLAEALKRRTRAERKRGLRSDAARAARRLLELAQVPTPAAIAGELRNAYAREAAEQARERRIASLIERDGALVAASSPTSAADTAAAQLGHGPPPHAPCLARQRWGRDSPAHGRPQLAGRHPRTRQPRPRPRARGLSG
jgi:hypothetical protein